MASAPKRGRPFKFADLEDLRIRIKGYFDSCDPHLEERLVEAGVNQKGETIWARRQVMTEQRPYLITGLARALGTNRYTLLNYENPDHYPPDFDEDLQDDLIDTIADAKERCQEFAEDRLYSPFNAGAKFSLQNNHGWEDRTIRENEGGLFGPGGKLEVEIVNPEPPHEVTPEPDAESGAPSTP